jgi:hypothetical protein
MLTAKNGATIDQSITGTACQSSPGTFDASGSYTITGGTGRFHQATGSGAFTANANGLTGQLRIAESGTINFNR